MTAILNVAAIAVPNMAGNIRSSAAARHLSAQNFKGIRKRQIMAENRTPSGQERDMTNNRLEGHSSIPGDLPTSPEDNEKLRTEATSINLPDVKDIPGQEFVNAPVIGEMADTTASSDDEEGTGIFDAENDDLAQGDSNVEPEERQALQDTTYMPTRDEDRLRRARMDNRDFQGEELNESSFGVAQELDGSDLDIDTGGDETRTTSMGQGDEENKYYSESDTDTNQPNENRTGA